MTHNAAERVLQIRGLACDRIQTCVTFYSFFIFWPFFAFVVFPILTFDVYVSRHYEHCSHARSRSIHHYCNIVYMYTRVVIIRPKELEWVHMISKTYGSR